MNRQCLIACLGLALLCVSTPLLAQENSHYLDVRAGMSATDNIARTPDSILEPAEDETIFSLGADFDVLRQGSRSFLAAGGFVERRSYENGIFEDETVSKLDASASYQLVDDRLTWTVLANHGQQIIDPFQPITPENREDITYLSTGPEVLVPVGQRTAIRSSLSFSDVQYETIPFENNRSEATVSLERQTGERQIVSLNLTGNRLEYDLDEVLAPVERYRAYLAWETETERSGLNVSLGWNQYERNGFEGDGVYADLSLRRQTTPYSSLTLSGGSQYSTNGDIFRLGQQLDSEVTGRANSSATTTDSQLSDEPFRNDRLNVTYRWQRDRTSFSVTANFSEETFETDSTLDRSRMGLRAQVSRRLSETMRASLGGAWNSRDYDSLDRDDSDLRLSARFELKIGARLTLAANLSSIERDSNLDEADYDELRATLDLVYRAFEL